LPPEAVPDRLSNSIKISRVAVGPSPRRPQSTKPVVKAEIPPRKAKRDARRYQSPPPRASRAKKGSYPVGGAENIPQYQREETKVQ
jgi:hypothetical protein